MNNFEIASQNLMQSINKGKESILSYRGAIDNRDNKYEELFDRLSEIDLEPENIKKQRLKNLIILIEQLKYAIYNKNYNDKVRMMQLIILIDKNKDNLKYILDNKEEITECEQILMNIKKILESKITSRATSYKKIKKARKI